MSAIRCAASSFASWPPDVSPLRRNIVYNVVGQILVMGLGLVAVRLVFRQLGADAFAVMLFGQSLGLVLASVLDLGISATIVREVAGQIHGDKAYVWDLLRTASLLYWAAYLIVTLAIIVSAPLLASHWLTLHELDASKAAAVMQILGAGVLLVLPRSLYASFFRGLQRMDVTNLIEVGALLLQLAGTIVILIGHGGIFQVAWWFTATYAASILAYVVFALRLHLPWRVLLPHSRPSVTRRNLRFLLHITSVSALGAVHGQMDKLLVSRLLPVAALGAYGFASTMVAGALCIGISLLPANLPAFAGLAPQRGRHGLPCRRQ